MRLVRIRVRLMGARAEMRLMRLRIRNTHRRHYSSISNWEVGRDEDDDLLGPCGICANMGI